MELVLDDKTHPDFFKKVFSVSSFFIGYKKSIDRSRFFDDEEREIHRQKKSKFISNDVKRYTKTLGYDFEIVDAQHKPHVLGMIITVTLTGKSSDLVHFKLKHL